LEHQDVTRLVATEVTRLLSRRFTSIALILLLVGLAGYQLVVNEALSPVTGQQLAAAQRSYEQSHQEWVDNHERYEQGCRDTGGTAEECTIPEPTLAEFSVAPTPFKEAVTTALEVSSVVVALVAFVIAASFIGAEYTTGSIVNWLTFVPRRGRVFWSKLLSLVGFAALLGALGAALVLAGAVGVAKLHDSHVESLRDLAEMGARSSLAAVALAVLGFCLAVITRHTAGALGVLLGYAIVWFLRMSVLAERAWVQRSISWTPEANLAAVVEHGYTYSVPVQKVTADGVNVAFVQHTLSFTHGASYWAVLMTLAVLSSLLIFRRRDVI
jgi:ABC-2 type transport system permease protein